MPRSPDYRYTGFRYSGLVTQPDELSSPPRAPITRRGQAKDSCHDGLTGEPDVPLSEVIDLIGIRARARAAGKFRAAAAFGVTVPALVLAFGGFFVSSVVQAGCLHAYGQSGACDPLPQIAGVTVIGHLLILEIAIGALLWSRRQPLEQRNVAGIYSTVAASVGWAVITSFFAAQWMSGNP